MQTKGSRVHTVLRSYHEFSFNMTEVTPLPVCPGHRLGSELHNLCALVKVWQVYTPTFPTVNYSTSEVHFPYSELHYKRGSFSLFIFPTVNYSTSEVHFTYSEEFYIIFYTLFIVNKPL